MFVWVIWFLLHCKQDWNHARGISVTHYVTGLISLIPTWRVWSVSGIWQKCLLGFSLLLQFLARFSIIRKISREKRHTRFNASVILIKKITVGITVLILLVPRKKHKLHKIHWKLRFLFWESLVQNGCVGPFRKVKKKILNVGRGLLHVIP